MKLKLKGAQTGHSLLKRKSEALTKRFRGITVKIDEVGNIMLLFLGAKGRKYSSTFIFGVLFTDILFTQLKRKMGQVMQLASFSLAEVQYITGDIR